MKRILQITILMVIAMSFGCQHGDFKATGVIAGQAAPFRGVNIGPELIIEEGQPVLMTGGLVWFKGLDEMVEPAE